MGELIMVMVSGAFLWWLLFVHDTGEWNSSRQQPPPPQKETPEGYNPFSNEHIHPLNKRKR